MHAQRGVAYRINQIAGKSEGPLDGPPNEYGRPVVKGDLLLKGQILDANVDIVAPHQQVFIIATPSEMSS
jgi:hypothetical protein